MSIENLCENVLVTSAQTDKEIIFKFKELIVKLLPNDFVNSPKIVGDLVPEKVRLSL